MSVPIQTTRGNVIATRLWRNLLRGLRSETHVANRKLEQYHRRIDKLSGGFGEC
jgi:hypothetical protein